MSIFMKSICETYYTSSQDFHIPAKFPKSFRRSKTQWYFAEEEALDVVQDLFMNNGITEIELIFKAPE